MVTSNWLPKVADGSLEVDLEAKVEDIINEVIESLPDPQGLSSEERRGIVARYTSVLEGNFIYWMTATLLSVHAEEARPIILDNLHEEVRDSHPDMMRRFAIQAKAFPTSDDAMAVHENLTKMRLFMGRLSGVQSLLAMGFFEGFIQRFMPYLAKLAAAQGSTEMEYTDVHGVCDIAHTEGLFKALAAETAVKPLAPGADILEGVYLLRDLIRTIVFDRAGQPA